MTRVEFLEKYLPDYYTRNDVMLLDDLYCIKDKEKKSSFFRKSYGVRPPKGAQLIEDINCLEQQLIDEAIRAALKTIGVYDDMFAFRWVLKQGEIERIYRNLRDLVSENGLQLEEVIVDIDSIGELERLQFKYVG